MLVYSYYRDAELRGSNLIYRLLRILGDPESQVLLSEHLADETRHAWLWTERIRELGGTPLPIVDGYQVRIGRRAGVPRSALELLALTVVVEQRALRRYQEHLKRDRRPRAHARGAALGDQGRGLAHRLGAQEGARARGARRATPSCFDRLLEKYRGIDREVMDEIEDLERQLATAA